MQKKLVKEGKEIEELDFIELIDEIDQFKDKEEKLFLILKTLAKKVDSLFEAFNYLKDFIPTKYKKFNPREGENPFFGYDNNFNNPKEREESFKRMLGYAKEANTNGLRKLDNTPTGELMTQLDRIIKENEKWLNEPIKKRAKQTISEAFSTSKEEESPAQAPNES